MLVSFGQIINYSKHKQPILESDFSTVRRLAQETTDKFCIVPDSPVKNKTTKIILITNEDETKFRAAVQQQKGLDGVFKIIREFSSRGENKLL